MVIAIVLGVGAIWYKSQDRDQTKTIVLGSETNRIVSPTEPPKPAKTFGEETQVLISTPTVQTIQKGPYAMEIDIQKQYQGVLHTTVGDITVQFTTKETPITVNNFIALAKRKFYDNTIFHRVIKGFMIQGGDPNGNGTGGPGYTFEDEPFTGEYTRGVLAMANAGPNTNGSQFFIMHADVPLPKNYVIFGKVMAGMDAVDKIATAPTIPTGEGSTPVTPIKIISVDVLEK